MSEQLNEQLSERENLELDKLERNLENCHLLLYRLVVGDDWYEDQSVVRCDRCVGDFRAVGYLCAPSWSQGCFQLRLRDRHHLS